MKRRSGLRGIKKDSGRKDYASTIGRNPKESNLNDAPRVRKGDPWSSNQGGEGERKRGVSSTAPEERPFLRVFYSLVAHAGDPVLQVGPGMREKRVGRSG